MAGSIGKTMRVIPLIVIPCLGLTLTDLARQVRQAFYGEEAQRIQRGRDDVRVMVRYPESERRSLGDLENMRIRTPEGGAEHPGVLYSLEGQQAEQRDTLGGLFRGFAIALLIIYALLAIPLRSYLQPLVIMTAIPFGLVGAIWGHFIMRLDLTILSMFGVVALAGVVVNDSLVMVDFIKS